MQTNNKLREALNRLVIASEGFLKTHSAKYYVDTTEALDKAKAALAEPPRNCDNLKTSWEVLKEWHGGIATANDIVRLLDWLLAPSTEKEGGAK